MAENAGAEGQALVDATASGLQTERQGNLPFCPQQALSKKQSPGKFRMRSALDRMYMTAAWLAALLMIGLLIMVLLSILGRQFGFHVRERMPTLAT